LNKLFVITALASFIVIAGCQKTLDVSQNADAVSKTAVETEEENKGTVANISTKMKNPTLCKAGSPPLKDKSKLKNMLVNSGKITAEMSVQQINQVIRNYINKKQKAFKRCKK